MNQNSIAEGVIQPTEVRLCDERFLLRGVEVTVQASERESGFCSSQRNRGTDYKELGSHKHANRLSTDGGIEKPLSEGTQRLKLSRNV